MRFTLNEHVSTVDGNECIHSVFEGGIAGMNRQAHNLVAFGGSPHIRNTRSKDIDGLGGEDVADARIDDAVRIDPPLGGDVGTTVSDEFRLEINDDKDPVREDLSDQVDGFPVADARTKRRRSVNKRRRLGQRHHAHLPLVRCAGCQGRPGRPAANSGQHRFVTLLHYWGPYRFQWVTSDPLEFCPALTDPADGSIDVRLGICSECPSEHTLRLLQPSNLSSLAAG